MVSRSLDRIVRICILPLVLIGCRSTPVNDNEVNSGKGIRPETTVETPFERFFKQLYNPLSRDYSDRTDDNVYGASHNPEEKPADF